MMPQKAHLRVMMSTVISHVAVDVIVAEISPGQKFDEEDEEKERQ